MMQAVRRLLRVLLGGLFMAAGMIKLRNPSRFAEEIANYQLLPQLAPHLAVMLPPLELMLGLAVIAAHAPWRRAAALGISVLLVLFMAATSAALARGINIDCGCFGSDGGPIDAVTIARDIALLAAAAAVVWLERPGARSRT